MMQLTYEQTKWPQSELDDLSADETRNIPFLGFATATVLSLAMWTYIAWMIWAVIR